MADPYEHRLDQSVKFLSQFQSGNLHAVYQKSKNVYLIVLRNDPVPKAKSGWFYFGIRNLPAKATTKLRIINMKIHFH